MGVRLTERVTHDAEPTDGRLAPDRSEAASLVQELLDGHPEALGAIYDRYGSRCYALAYRVLRDATLAEDAVQEAFLALWRAPERFDSVRGSLITYLLTLTHRRAVDVLRRETHQRRGRITVEVLAEVPSTQADVGTQAETAMRSDVVREALGELPEAQREALTLAYFQGFTQREIAAITGVPLGTVKTRMLAGVRRMRADLGNWHQAWGS